MSCAGRISPFDHPINKKKLHGGLFGCPQTALQTFPLQTRRFRGQKNVPSRSLQFLSAGPGDFSPGPPPSALEVRHNFNQKKNRFCKVSFCKVISENLRRGGEALWWWCCVRSALAHSMADLVRPRPTPPGSFRGRGPGEGFQFDRPSDEVLSPFHPGLGPHNWVRTAFKTLSSFSLARSRARCEIDVRTHDRAPVCEISHVTWARGAQSRTFGLAHEGCAKSE